MLLCSVAAAAAPPNAAARSTAGADFPVAVKKKEEKKQIIIGTARKDKKHGDKRVLVGLFGRVLPRHRRCATAAAQPVMPPYDDTSF